MIKGRGRPAPKNATPEESYQAALKTALHILGYKDNSERMLAEKLTERGYTPETIEEVKDFLVKKGYLNEERMLVNTARSLALGRGYGRRRIVSELRRKKFEEARIASLDFESDLEEVDFVSVCQRLIQKRGGARDEKTYAFLLRYGHSPADIREAYRRIEKSRNEETI